MEAPRLCSSRRLFDRFAKAAAPVLVASILATSNAGAALAGEKTGEYIFQGNCQACHAGGNNIISAYSLFILRTSFSPGFQCSYSAFCLALRTVSDKTLKKEALEKYLDGGFKPEAVAKQVTNGKGAMPAFGNRLSDDEIALVAEYVISTSEAGWE